MRPSRYEELNDLASLVNLLRASSHALHCGPTLTVALQNAATAIEGLQRERDAMAEDCRSLSERVARLVAAAANDDKMRPGETG